MRIGIDIMGGDFAPVATVLGSILAYNQIDENIQLVLIGDKYKIRDICQKEGFDISRFDVVHTSEYIVMGEHPSKAFAQKPDASIVVGFKMLRMHEIDALASAGNTGAMLVGGIHIVKSVPGVIRPCITAAIPRNSGNPVILLDVGINPDCKPDVLYQYAILGSLYSEYVYNVSNPRVGLLNIGAEEEKGNLLTKTTYQAMKDSKDFNFIGNIEGNEFFSDRMDVIVCDGFVGNVMLKEAEAFYALMRKRNIKDDYFEKFNFENYGGTPMLGINTPVIIGHGISNEIAIKNMILHTVELTSSGLTQKIKEFFNNDKN